MSIRLYAHDQVLLSGSDDTLQRSFCTLNRIINDYNLSIFTEKTKLIASRDKRSPQGETVMSN